MVETTVKLAAGTDVGLVRKNNEDNFVVSRDLSQPEWVIPASSETILLGKYGCLLVVADGMGGTNAGEIASAIAVETIQKAFVPSKLEKVVTEEDTAVLENKVEAFLRKTIKAADLNIARTSKEDSSTQGMGTTIVMAWLLQDKAYIAWCGDSRCYVFNARSGFCRLSKDHSYVQTLVDQGDLDPENTIDHPYSNIITRCLGDSSNSSEADFRSYNLADGDMLLLCTDGLCGVCHDETIMQIIESHPDNPTVCKDQLIAAALAEGGYDNVTVALCHVSLSNNDTPSDNELKNTVFTKPHRGRKIFGIFLLLLVLFIAIGLWLYRNPLSRTGPTECPLSADTTCVTIP